MSTDTWNELLLSSTTEDAAWELFHENSKLGRYFQGLSEEQVVQKTQELHESLPFEGFPLVELPVPLATPASSLSDTILNRVSVRNFSSRQFSLGEVATLLHYSYGVTRNNQGTNLSRSFRAVPSGGALYPLEIFFHCVGVDGLLPGLYHYNSAGHHVRRLRAGDERQSIAEAIIQPDLALEGSLMIFITAMFERTVFKYGDRGYRFALLEAGHVAQNMNLVATALKLGCVNIGGFYDRDIDAYLDLDGILHSTIYMMAIGEPKRPDQ
ncbi:SagB/ThcOx family dehydrogenase [Candidatus Nitronereus thalassa]|uniref:SagB/ThcOx family dehydrogenase n=1 Tax=Candidatus Nitronereus thalassa TaxID=3020898 RepID=A0ABU3K9J6_9BACT|nr:SagB/ThcOx family dehydrogenase [Candidatus Nitronereus thalassa]MDT7043056.1 SagB/ThcOx family dehydrogenase [Candidatus Nitronereus thalassa]